MSIVRLENISVSFAGALVLEGVDFRVETGDRIGLIGRNGTGKTTLFRLLAGTLEPESGLVERMKRAKIAHLHQLPEVPGQTSLYEVVLDSFGELLELEQQLRDLEEKLDGAAPAVLEDYAHLQETFRVEGGYEYEQRIKRVLTGLGFREDEFGLPFEALSGGQRTRLMLALVLLEDADLLLLDEPENHLDLQAREWLEAFLAEWPKAFIVISHDRRMLNRVTRRTVEVERAGVWGFNGPYDVYLKEKAIRDENHQKAYERQREHIAREEKWIDRFRYKNTKSRQVQSHIKRLDKLERIDAPRAEGAVGKFSYDEVTRSGQVVMEARDLSMAYGDLGLYEGVSFSVERGERLGIIGPNGSGKTTLLRHLHGTLDGGTGQVNIGHKVTLGYYDQQQGDLNPANDVLQEAGTASPGLTPGQLRSFLGRFLFYGDDVFKPIRALSGGERGRVALAKLVLGKANLLLLDEPTNHLDIASREALETSLAEFPGTIIMVSHDRTLIDKLVDRLIVVESGQALVHDGNYSHYLWKLSEPGPVREYSQATGSLKIRNHKNDGRRAQKDADRELRRQRKRIEALEEAIHALETALEEYGARFAELDPADYKSVASLDQEYAGLKRDLESKFQEWEVLSGQMAD